MQSSRRNVKRTLGDLRAKASEFRGLAEKNDALRGRALDSLSYNVKKKNWYKKYTLEPLEVIKEVPVEVIKEVEVEVEVVPSAHVGVEVGQQRVRGQEF